MKKSIGFNVSVPMLFLVAMSASNALACQDYGCTDKAGVFNDVLTFSQGLQNCPTFSNDQALDIARAVNAGQIGYGAFKKVYQQTCNYSDAFTSSSVKGKSKIVVDLIQFSAGLQNCPTFSDAQAMTLADQILSGSVREDDFKVAYAKTCNLSDSTSIASNHANTQMFVDLLSFSAGLQSCPTFSDSQSIALVQDADSGILDYQAFKQAYQKTCDYSFSITAGANQHQSDIVVDLLNFSANLQNCPTFSDEQALRLAQQIISGVIVEQDFKLTYAHTCDINVSIEASRCQKQ